MIGIALPFASPYRPFWTGIGVVGGYGLAALGLSYYARARLGSARWRAAHRFTILFWAAAVAHSLAGGTDSGQPWFLAFGLLALGPAAGLATARVAEMLAEQRARQGRIKLPTLDEPLR
jgi:methionine sulfoxide reductase heme-binding subunit